MNRTGGAIWKKRTKTAVALLLAFGGSGFALAQSSSSNLPAAPQPSGTTDIGGSTGGGSPVQLTTGNSLYNSYLGSVQSQPAVPHEIPLTLEDAFKLGIENNLGAVYSVQSEKLSRAQRSQTFNVLLPQIDVQGGTAFHQFNLAAEGFGPGIAAQFAPLLPPGQTLSFPSIVKVDVTQGQANLSQYLFNWGAIDAYRAYGHLVKGSHENVAVALGQSEVTVGNAYFQVIAAQAQLKYDQALLETDNRVLYQTSQMHQAGTVANLDELRARVQYQTQQQDTIRDANTLAKAKIALNRTIGLAPEQQILLKEETPFPDLNSEMAPEEAFRLALAQRHIFRNAQEQVLAYESAVKAAHHERYPTLLFNGDYGVQGTSGGNYVGIFSAVGSLNIPIFQEAKFRSDRESAQFQLENARAQLANIRQQIAQQVRDALIDLRTADEVMKVALSNFSLAQVALNQSQERFQAGLSDNLPTIEAISTMVAAQAQVVNATYKYNVARLAFAQYLGELDRPAGEGDAHPAGVTNNRAAQEYE